MHNPAIPVALLAGFVLMQSTARATIQRRDMLIANGDTLYVEEEMLAKAFMQAAIRARLFPGHRDCRNPGEDRGFYATWLLDGGQLYLTGVYSACYAQDSLSLNPAQLGRGQGRNGRLRARWVSGTVSAGKTPLNISLDAIQPFYREEVTMVFERGTLVQPEERLLNWGTQASEYANDQRKLNVFIRQHLDWNALPERPGEQPLRVDVRFSANEYGRIDSVEIVRPVPEPYALEAARVLRSLPFWEVVFRHGRLVRVPWFYTVIFDEADRPHHD